MTSRTVHAPTEAEFQAQVVELAGICGWEHNHTRRTIGRGRKWVTATSRTGWPDLTLWHPSGGGVLFVELKTDTGKVSADQQRTLTSLASSGAEVHVWRPRDWDTIVARLQAPRGRSVTPANQRRSPRCGRSGTRLWSYGPGSGNGTEVVTCPDCGQQVHMAVGSGRLAEHHKPAEQAA